MSSTDLFFTYHSVPCGHTHRNSDSHNLYTSITMPWTRAAPLLEASSLPLQHQLLIMALSYDRAALVLEIPPSWVTFDLAEIKRRIESLVPLSERDDPSRYLPSSRERHPGESWLDFVNASRPKGWLWIETIAAHGPISMHCIAHAIELNYREHHMLPSMNIGSGSSSEHYRSIAQLCSDSSLPSLGRVLHDEHNQGIITLGTDLLGPRRSLDIMVRDLRTASSYMSSDTSKRRFPGHLLLVHSIRVQLLSVQKSWKSLRSGIFCWGEFMKAFYPYESHLPIKESRLLMYMSIFKNGGTMGQYISHLRMASRISGIPWLVSAEIASAVTRGLKKVTIRHQAGILTSRQFEDLVRHMIRISRLDLARFIVVAHLFMHRVQSELAPLQLDGRTLAGHRWHSFVDIQRHHISITYHHRKNAPHGATIKRTCICKKGPSLSCGVCALRAHACRHHQDKHKVVFPSISLSRDIRVIRNIAADIGVQDISWHSFRRSAAHTMLKQGGTISQIIRAGGWKSSAFLQYLSRRDVDDRAHLELIHQDSESDTDP